MADQKPSGAKRLGTIILLVIAGVGLGYGGYLLAQDQPGSLPVFIGAAIVAALASILGATGKKG